MNMDNDQDFTLSPSGVIYAARAIKLDPSVQDGCFLGSLNSMCIGITPQQSEIAPGVIGNSTTPYVLGDVPANLPFVPGSITTIPVYGPGRRCLIDIDPAFGGQIRPNDLIISGNSGYGTKAASASPWNQWIIGISTSFANSGQSCNVKIVIFPWSPTGS